MRRALVLLSGWCLIALAIVVLVRVQLGVAPYDVLSTALAKQLNVAPGTASWITCSGCLGVAYMLKVIPGIGTLAGAFVVGGLINLGLNLVADIDPLVVRVPLFGCALIVMYLGVCCIIVSRVGAGPTELVTIGLMQRGLSIRAARWMVEGSCLIVGIVLGGSFGVGTVVLMAASGPLLGFLLPRVRRRTALGNELVEDGDKV
jgi:uncharacterized membrane protein YczE